MTTTDFVPGAIGTDLRPERTADGDRVRASFFMVSSDTHGNEPADLWEKGIDTKYRHRIPRIEVDAKGERWSLVEGHRPSKIREMKLTGEEKERADAINVDLAGRLAHSARDGIDAEVIFPGRGLSMWATPDPVFASAMCRVYNDWAMEYYGEVYDRLSPIACISPGDVEGAVAEVYRAAEMGFRGVNIPVQPLHGSNPDSSRTGYHLPIYDPVWAAIQETGMPITMHVATGKDPRGAGGDGGAVINYAWHALATAMEPVVQTCASGLFERFPGLQFATIEAGCGWAAWLHWAADEAYEKTHFWAFPKLKMRPSEYAKLHWSYSFQDDPMGIQDAVDWYGHTRLVWGNDYPHHEGTWPRSAEVILRTMGHLPEWQMADVIGLNAARLFGFRVPAEYKYQP